MKTALDEPEVGCLWCGTTLDKVEDLFCDHHCRRMWMSDAAI